MCKLFSKLLYKSFSNTFDYCKTPKYSKVRSFGGGVGFQRTRSVLLENRKYGNVCEIACKFDLPYTYFVANYHAHEPDSNLSPTQAGLTVTAASVGVNALVAIYKSESTISADNVDRGTSVHASAEGYASCSFYAHRN